MIFKTYIFESFKVRIVDSHSLGLCASLVCLSMFFISDGERCIQTFSKYCAIEKYGILRTTILQNKRERNTKQKNFF